MRGTQIERDEVPQWIRDFETEAWGPFPVELFRLKRGYVEVNTKMAEHPFFLELSDHDNWRVLVWVLEECQRRYPKGQHYRDNWNRIRRSVTPKVYARDGHVCRHCGATGELSVDHIVPLVAGGSNDLRNLQILCRSCNSRKGVRVG